MFFVFFIVSFMARSVLHEREQGTLRRLRIAPVRPMSILSGKTLPFLLLSVAQTPAAVRLRPNHVRFLVGIAAAECCCR